MSTRSFPGPERRGPLDQAAYILTLLGVAGSLGVFVWSVYAAGHAPPPVSPRPLIEEPTEPGKVKGHSAEEANPGSEPPAQP
jgi:hypothetical protein